MRRINSAAAALACTALCAGFAFGAPPYESAENTGGPTIHAADQMRQVPSKQSVGRQGDANLDSRVDVRDLLLVVMNFGNRCQGKSCVTDLNGNGWTDIRDFLAVVLNWD